MEKNNIQEFEKTKKREKTKHKDLVLNAWENLDRMSNRRLSVQNFPLLTYFVLSLIIKTRNGIK